VHAEREGRLRVLVADDHEALRREIVTLLDPVFEIVAVVSNGRALVDEVVALEPDVIVSDLMMPALTGIEALAKLRAAGYRIPFVLQTTDPDAQAWLDAGAHCVVHKLDLESDLVTAVRSAAAGKVFLSRSLTK
jgi:DNA-binding NarL/FixJ family response regulator